jgi:type II secretory pathway component PulM
MTTALNWLAAALFAIVFFWVIEQVTKNDAHTERMQAINAEMRELDKRMDRAASDLCRSELGPGAQVLWTREGDLVCRPGVLTAGGVK